MDRKQFDFEFGRKNGVNFFFLTKDIIVFKKPLSIFFEKTQEDVLLTSVNDLFKMKITKKDTNDIEVFNMCGVHFEDELSVRKIIEYTDNLRIYDYEGKGYSSHFSNYRFSNASEHSIGISIEHHPAEANVKIKKKNIESAIYEFAKNYKSASHEYAYSIDLGGYVHKFSEGGKHSVKVGSGKNRITVHNHPSGSNFSLKDLVSTSASKSVGVIAIGGKYTYSFTKGTHFKTKDFIKAVRSSNMSGKSYDDAVHRWLSGNQKKYGYVYKRSKTK